ncbi:hypothetical protein OIU74_002015, partial [Salix koriyanagi]
MNFFIPVPEVENAPSVPEWLLSKGFRFFSK